jgi:hypothetical protein
MKQFISAFLIIIISMLLGAICFPNLKEANAGLFLNLFKTVEYSGHTYIVHISSEYFLHDPDCKCMKGVK